ncbi:MAG TPA: hypothetical protein VFT06_05725 [Flavisolibacter sp.]|jgi:hypothetical protein|nr:hypothetical protein [Flavisolibacter sp.]
MTIKQFRAASHNVQVAIVQFEGAFLLKRRGGGMDLLLYQVGDFYVEVVCIGSGNRIRIIGCYSFEEIDHYLAFIDISVIKKLTG